MKKTSVKVMAAILVIFMLLPAMSGCAGKPAAGKPANAPAVGTSAPKSSLASEKPIEITVFMADRADAPMTGNVDVVKELAKRTNITFKWELAPPTNVPEKFNLVIASGEIPDIMIHNMNDLLKYADKGAFEPLNEWIDKNAPNVKKAIGEDKKVLKELTYSDGKIYTIPMLAAVKLEKIFIVRKDWLDKLGLKEPASTDEWYNVLKAFKEKDPNGNGKADEIPFATRNQRGGVFNFHQSWGLQEEFFLEDGKVKFGAADPRMKDVLAYMNKLYKEKLIDSEYLTTDQKQWQAKFTNELAGATFDWGARLDFLNTETRKVNVKANFQPALPPKGPTGIQMTLNQMTKIRDGGSAAISAKSKYKKEIVRMYDYIFSDEGSILMNFGIEGTHYKMENGIPKYTDAVMKNPDKAPQIALFNFGMNRDWPMRQDVRYEDAFTSDDVKKARTMYDPFIKDYYPKLKFNDKEREVITAKYTEIKTYKDEMMDKFIMGTESLEKFDDFVKKVKSMGLDDVIKVHEEALKRYNQN